MLLLPLLLLMLLIYLRYFVRISLVLTFIFLFIFTVIFFTFHFALSFCVSFSVSRSYSFAICPYYFCLILYLYSLFIRLDGPSETSFYFFFSPFAVLMFEQRCGCFETAAMFLYWLTGYKEQHENILFLLFNGFHFVCTFVFA